MLVGRFLVAFDLGDFGRGLLDLCVLVGLLLLSHGLLDLFTVADLGGFLDLLKELQTLFRVLNQGEVQGDLPVDLFRTKVIKAHLVKAANPLGLTEPTGGFARDLENFLVVVFRLPQGLHDAEVGKVADDLAGLVGLEGDPQGHGVIHEFDPAIDPIVHFAGGFVLARCGIKTQGVVLAKNFKATEASFAVDDLKMLTRNAEPYGILQPFLLDGVPQLLHLGFFDAFCLGLSILVDKPPRVAIHKFPILHRQPRLRKLDLFALDPEQVPVQMLDFVAENFRYLRNSLHRRTSVSKK